MAYPSAISIFIFGWRGDDYWVLPQAAQYKIQNRFTVERRFGFDVLDGRTRLGLTQGLNYSHIDQRFTRCKPVRTKKTLPGEVR